MLDWRNEISKKLEKAVEVLGFKDIQLNLENNDERNFGNLFTSVACKIGSKIKKTSKEIGEEIVSLIETGEYISQMRVEENGFINIKLSDKVFEDFYLRILDKKHEIGKLPRNGFSKYIEIVSANPTGYLHIGHIRQGVLTDTLSNLYEYVGYYVRREYLVNDAGSQIDSLISSFWYFWNKKTQLNRELNDEKTVKYEYSGPSLDDCVDYLWNIHKNDWFLETEGEIEDSPFYETVRREVVDYYLNKAKEILSKYQINVVNWIKESSFCTKQKINDTIRYFLNKDKLLMKDGAIWLNLKDKPEVLIKNNGNHTYYMQDLIYHQKKLNLIGKSDEIIDVIGCDHYGHADRLKEGWKLISGENDQLTILLMQLVQLKKDNKVLTMSKRKSTAIYAKDLEEYMNYDEIRWYFISQPITNPLEIEIEKLKNKDYNNKIYYVMYTYSRASSILNKTEYDYKKPVSFKDCNEKEREILNVLINYEDLLYKAANKKEPNQITNYINKLTKIFNSYYEETNILNSPEDKIHSRLSIVYSVQSVIKSALKIMNIEAQEEI